MSLFDEDETLIQVSKNMMINKDSFVNRFGNDHEFEVLITHKHTDDKWKERFEWMKEQGILN